MSEKVRYDREYMRERGGGERGGRKRKWLLLSTH